MRFKKQPVAMSYMKNDNIEEDIEGIIITLHDPGMDAMHAVGQ